MPDTITVSILNSDGTPVKDNSNNSVTATLIQDSIKPDATSQTIDISVTGLDISTLTEEDKKKYKLSWESNGKTITAEGGTYQPDSTTPAKTNITGLAPKGAFELEIGGTIEIGDPNATGGQKVAKIIILLSNRNPHKDWILSFSGDPTKGDKEAIKQQEELDKNSELNLTALIDWISNKAGNVVKPDTSELGDSDFVLVFHTFWFNLSKGTFKIDVRSKDDSKLKVVNNTIEISDVKLYLTNQGSPAVYEELKLIEKKED